MAKKQVSKKVEKEERVLTMGVNDCAIVLSENNILLYLPEEEHAKYDVGTTLPAHVSFAMCLGSILGITFGNKEKKNPHTKELYDLVEKESVRLIQSSILLNGCEKELTIVHK